LWRRFGEAVESDGISGGPTTEKETHGKLLDTIFDL
jgi:hypothetical protein